jgi:meso-butanediol dehydrogenase/(S,S)-butanediol dehydrogenase/diacetyl reductase
MSRARFEGKVVLVTGASSGLGLESSRLFINEGATVLATDLEEQDVLEELGREMASFVRCDVGNPEDCEQAIRICIERYGRLDILFHNAGHWPALSLVEDIDVNAFRKVIEVDLNSLFYLARAAVPAIKRHGGGGAIVVTASNSGLAGDAGNSSYAAAKAGIINMARCLAIDHGKDKIRVNCVCPGYMITPMTSIFRDVPEIEQKLHDAISLGRGAAPREIANVVLFLASEEASFMTGQGQSNQFKSVLRGITNCVTSHRGGRRHGHWFRNTKYVCIVPEQIVKTQRLQVSPGTP